jgi:hypothetical protein
MGLGSVRAQTPSVRFSQLPAPLQLYPRSAQNTADVPVGGRVLRAGFGQVSLQVFRNNALFLYQKQPLAYDSTGAAFAFKTTLRAELAEYRFEVFLHGSADSLRVARRDSVVCGDAFLITGQSNATTTQAALQEYNTRTEFCRSFGKQGDKLQPADTLWSLSDLRGAIVGVWGTELQKLISQAYRVPVCIINGGMEGTEIGYHYRNDANPLDLSTAYGRMLYRTQRAGLQSAMKALFWRQGEAEAYFNKPGYARLFDPLYRAWMQDFPGLRRVYVFQNNLIEKPSVTAGEVLEFQRRSPQIYPNVTALATVGTPGYTPPHYNAAGYVYTAFQVFRLVARDFYGGPASPQIDSPNLRKLFYTTPRHDGLQLVFDEGQALRWPADSTVRDANGIAFPRKIADVLLLDGKAGAVRQGTAEGNVVTLRLARPDSARTLSYLPPSYLGTPFFDGPYLRNGRGLGAFAFYNVPIAEPLNPPVLVADASREDTIRVSWSQPAADPSVRYVLERSDDQGRRFSPVATFPDSVRSFTDTQNLLRGYRYLYRIRAVAASTESPFDTTAVVSRGYQILNFTAKVTGYQTVQLDWTATPGAAGFAQSVLERSTRPDGGFAEIARLPYPRTSYADSLLQPNTTYFYRLRVRDDGAESPTVTVSARTLTVTGTEPAAGTGFGVFPNPTRRVVSVQWPTPQSGRLTLTDALGHVHLGQSFENRRCLDLALPSLPPGLYLLRAETATGTHQKKLLVE